MKAKIIQIGNSQGIRIPKTVIEQLGFEGDVYLEIGESELVIRNASAPRTGWEAAFSEMATHEDDVLLEDKLIKSDWDDKEWAW